jgi:opacity protein-like surface antigen
LPKFTYLSWLVQETQSIQAPESLLDKGVLMIRTLIVSSLMLNLVSANVLAGSMGEVYPNWTFVAAVSEGFTWAQNGRPETFYLAPEIEKTFTTQITHNPLVVGDVFLGVLTSWPYQLQSHIGLDFAALSTIRFNGQVWDDADPVFNNYLYWYKLQHTRLSLKGKFLFDQGSWFMPWVSASVGVGFNHAYGFDNEPTIPGIFPSENFANHSVSTFSWTVGAGIQKWITNHWQAGLGYEFADLGKHNLGKAFEQTLNGGLSLNHLYTNGFLFNITYVA